MEFGRKEVGACALYSLGGHLVVARLFKQMATLLLQQHIIVRVWSYLICLESSQAGLCTIKEMIRPPVECTEYSSRQTGVMSYSWSAQLQRIATETAGSTEGT